MSHTYIADFMIIYEIKGRNVRAVCGQSSAIKDRSLKRLYYSAGGGTHLSAEEPTYPPRLPKRGLTIPERCNSTMHYKCFIKCGNYNHTPEPAASKSLV